MNLEKKSNQFIFMKNLYIFLLKNRYLTIFILSAASRYIFAAFSGINNFQHPDWSRYDMQSDQILSGNFNLETKLFITAPLFSYLVAGMKLFFKSNYPIYLELFQIILNSVSSIFLMKTSLLIFRNIKIEILSGIAYSIYPITLYFTHQFSQESIFQSLLLIFYYFYNKFISTGKIKYLFIFSIIFSLALLTKSHIILSLPFLLAGIFLNKKSCFKDIFIFLFVIFTLTMPYGIYNKLINGTYVIASTGLGGHFLTGHNDDFYTYVSFSYSSGDKEYKRLKNMDFHVYKILEDKTEGMTHQEKQMLYLKEGVRWSVENKDKALKLLKINFLNFISPGFNINHHPYKMWILTYILSLPIFVLAYFSIAREVYLDFKNHIAIISIFIGMLIFSLFFYTQNRFRVVTIEPFYLIYACSGFVYLSKKKNQ